MTIILNFLWTDCYVIILICCYLNRWSINFVPVDQISQNALKKSFQAEYLQGVNDSHLESECNGVTKIGGNQGSFTWTINNNSCSVR